MVDKAYRGKGYGLATWNYSFRSVPEGCNCALGTLEEMTHKYGLMVLSQSGGSDALLSKYPKNCCSISALMKW